MMNSDSQTAQVFLLPAFLDLTAAESLTENLLRLRGESLWIDASKVEKLGALCLQVLISAEKTWRTDGISFAIHDPSTNFSASLDQFGIDASILPVRDSSS